MITFACSQCDRKLRVKEDLAGKKARCPQCGQLVAIPAPTVSRTRNNPHPATPPTEEQTLPPLNRVAPPGESETLAPSAGQPAQPATVPAGQTPTGDNLSPGAIQVPGYQVLDELGRGGMGVVYRARHLQLNRVVALKMVLAGGHAGTAERDRFLVEAEAVAALQHVNIVQVFDFGQHGELPYMALEYVNGGSLHGRLSEGLPRPLEAAWLVEQLARGVAVAHGKGIVHRDLKPHNVLLAVPDGSDPTQTPLRQCTPKVTDFGLAKKVEGESGLTQTGAIMGTPSYMPPEQAQGDRKVGPAADVYALGAILYECLTGRPPFRGPTAMETIMQLVMDEPVPPSQLQAKMPRDLETICLKCLQKVPEKRYATALELAEDLRRYQAGEPIKARPVGAVERGVRWVRRNPVVAGLSAGLVLALSGGLVASLLFAFNAHNEAVRADEQTVEAKEKARLAREAEGKALEAEGKEREAKGVAEQAAREARAAREEAEREARAARQREYDANLLLVHNAWGQHQVHRFLDILERQKPQPGQEDLRGFEWHYWKKLLHQGHQSLPHGHAVFSVAFSPGDRRLASGCNDGTVRIWDLATGREALTLQGHPGSANSVAFSPDGKQLVSAGGHENRQGILQLWDASTGHPLLSVQGHTSTISSVCFSPDGKRLATASADRTVKVWDAVTGRETFSYKGHAQPVRSVAFSPDSKTVASGSSAGDPDKRGVVDGEVRLWDARDGRERRVLRNHTGQPRGVSFHPDGKRLIVASEVSLEEGTVKVYDLATGGETVILQGSTGAAVTVACSADGKRLAAAGRDAVVRVWDAATGQEALTLQGHTDQVVGVAFSPDGKQLASASWDTTVKLWDALRGQEPLTLGGLRHQQSQPFRGSVMSLVNASFAPDGKRVASASDDRTVTVWDAATSQECLTLKGHRSYLTSVSFSRDGKRLASGSWDRTARLWDTASGNEVLTLKEQKGAVFSVTFTPDSRRLAAGIQDGMVRIWDTASGQEVLSLKGPGGTVFTVAFSPDGRRLAAGGQNGMVRIWDLPAGQEVLTYNSQSRPVFSVAFSPDGKRLATAGVDQTARVWDVLSGREALTLRGHTGLISSVCFSPDGKRLATASADRTVKVWDAATAGETLTLDWQTTQITGVAFSPNGKRLAAASAAMTVRLWDADSGE